MPRVSKKKSTSTGKKSVEQRRDRQVSRRTTEISRRVLNPVLPAPKAKVEVDRRLVSRPGLKAFFNIANHWGLSNEEQMTLLGLTSASTFYKWKKSPPETLSKDTLERISYILGIYKSLQILLPENPSADQWVKKPNKNPLFGGKAALDRMLSGNVGDLFVVRQYLDAQRGGWA